MSGDLKKLYSATIRLHNETPFHFEKKAGELTLKAYNPVCGDSFDLYATFEDDKIIQLHFHGYGCAISKASTSVMAQTLEGKTFDEALKICDNFLDVVDKKASINQPLYDEFRAFSAASDFPERHDCATLSWHEMRKYLQVRKSIDLQTK